VVLELAVWELNSFHKISLAVKYVVMMVKMLKRPLLQLSGNMGFLLMNGEFFPGELYTPLAKVMPT
jgi:hypothetical protein